MRQPGKTSKKGPKQRSLNLFDPPPLIEGEDPADYAELRDRISAVVNPRDTIEEILVGDLVNLQWDIIRYRRLKAILMCLKKSEGLLELDHLRDAAAQCFTEEEEGGFNELVDDWLDHNVTKRVDKIFASVGLTMHAVMAMTLFTNIDVIARIDDMIAIAEERRNAALREIDRHRIMLAQTLQRPVEQIENMPPEMLETKASTVESGLDQRE